LTNHFSLHDVTEADVDGAIFCPVLAKYIIDLKVDFDFPGHGTFTGTVTNFDAKENFSGLWLIDAESAEIAKELAFKASKACNRKVELRPLH
jgi:hypothetical protein